MMTMMNLDQGREARFLGLDCGGTHSVGLLVDEAGKLLQRAELGPANLRLISDAGLVRHFKALKPWAPTAIGVGMAGARTPADRQRIEQALARVWPGVPGHVTHDLDTALESAGDDRSGTARVLVLSGTGSCCFGRAGGRTAKIGGWGHLLGDKGSGYEIGLRSVKAVVYYYDRDGKWSSLGRRILRALQLNEPNDLIEWAQGASKAEVASLAKEVFAAWGRKDRIATDILTGAAGSLSRDALTCAARLVRKGEPVEFILAGGILIHQPRFAAWVERGIRDKMKSVTVKRQEREGAWGAVKLARRLWEHPARPGVETAAPAEAIDDRQRLEIKRLALSPTERRNPRSMNLDRMTVREGVRLMLSEEAKVSRALLKVEAGLEWIVKRVVRSLRKGGSLFYAGAGTSGRLGVLDASECPPTFRTAPETVQGIIAGGRRALWQSVEGAEDDAGAGARAVGFRGVRRGDVVIGIAASGRTPFVLGALAEAGRLGATTVLLCFNPSIQLPPGQRPERLVAVDVGPEVLTGSTRLKAGTATKVALNVISTMAMVRLGKVKGNLMIDVSASNTKLKDRAVRIVQELTGADEGRARVALVRTRWKVKEACGRIG